MNKLSDPRLARQYKVGKNGRIYAVHRREFEVHGHSIQSSFQTDVIEYFGKGNRFYRSPPILGHVCQNERSGPRRNVKGFWKP